MIFNFEIKFGIKLSHNNIQENFPIFDAVIADFGLFKMIGEAFYAFVKLIF